jgi:hypothetical protein
LFLSRSALEPPKQAYYFLSFPLIVLKF